MMRVNVKIVTGILTKTTIIMEKITTGSNVTILATRLTTRPNRNISRNVIASDIGLIAKRGGDGNTIIIANDLKSTQPLAGVQLELYDYQQQLIGSANTGSDGKSTIVTQEKSILY